MKTIGEKSNIVTAKVKGENFVANPSLLFDGITFILTDNSEMEEFLSYELAPQPPSLFKNGMMHKPAKRSLELLLKSFSPAKCSIPENEKFLLQMTVICFRLWFGHKVPHMLMYVSHILRTY